MGGYSLERAALGKRIRESRIKKEYTQQYLASKADIGVVYLSEIERGVKMPSLNIFIKIIDALDVSADYILRDEISSGKEYICMEITEKLLALTPPQRKTATDILNAYLNNLL
jgi:transcriptional regulator with XRE-family HTH domain